ncbi:MAG TPA: methyltransferase [Steroidobacteraceae bacterium]|nr:methyltransferase [Steroidobacteraceae bacterium]
MRDVARSLLGPASPGAVGWLLGKGLEAAMRVTRRWRYDDHRVERIHGLTLLVLPGVANPRLLRTGAFFADCLKPALFAGRAVLDMGTGSGVCALMAARHAARVVAVDISRAAVRCAHINAVLNQLEDRIDLRHGDLFEPVSGEQFDMVLFNPPFLLGAPADERDAAWRSVDVASRFARGLDARLAPRGFALLLLSTFGNACAGFIDELRMQGFELQVCARRRYVNETVTLLRVERRGDA